MPLCPKSNRIGNRPYSFSGPRDLAFRPLLTVLCLALFFSGCVSIQAGGEIEIGKFAFGVIGDQQYDAESEAKFPNLINHLNQANLAFVAHVGDFKGSAVPCSDELFYRRREQFQASKHPLIYTPGDNEWTDCHRAKPIASDPIEKLAKLREVFFQGDQSLGQRVLTLARQSNDPKYAKFRENARWLYGDVLFVTLHIVDSNNNLGRTPDMDAEYTERNAANLAWMKQAFDLAKRNGNKAVVIFMQANPFFEDTLPPARIRGPRIAAPSKKPSGFSDFLSALQIETVAFGKPVALVHGGTHYFRVDKPMFSNHEAIGGLGRQIENFTRLEAFGFPEAHWIRIIVDPNIPDLFAFEAVNVKRNVFDHSPK